MLTTRCARAGMLVVSASLAMLVAGGGVAQAISLGDDGDSPIDGIPLINDGSPETCSITSSDPYRKRTCNQDGHDGRDGEDGAVHGSRSGEHRRSEVRAGGERRAEAAYADDLGPDVNGAPGRPGAPRAVVTPGAAPAAAGASRY